MTEGFPADTRMAAFTAIDLFSGVGGLSRGLVDAGFTMLAAIEVERLAADSYRKNFPEVVLWQRDIRTINAPSLLRRLGLQRGELDLLAGCPPCEGFSSMRTLNGALSPMDPRNDLVLQIIKFVKAFHPRMVMIENVPALAADVRIDRFEKKLSGLGYAHRCDIVDASNYGVPQRRKRMILMASRLGPPPPNPSYQPTVTVREAIGSLPPAGLSADPLHDHGEWRSPAVRRLISRVPHDGGSRTDLPLSDQLACHLSCDGFKDVYGRMAWDSVAPTITGGCVNPSKGRFLHPGEDRAITLREASLLQTFPKDHWISLL